jgi:hypothetical protein
MLTEEYLLGYSSGTPNAKTLTLFKEYRNLVLVGLFTESLEGKGTRTTLRVCYCNNISKPIS